MISFSLLVVAITAAGGSVNDIFTAIGAKLASAA